MSWLDRFKGDKPQQRPTGRSGRGHYRGHIEALEELTNDLRHPLGAVVFNRMYRTDGDVRRSLSMVCNPLTSSTWSVEPYGGDDADDKARKHAEFVRWLIFESMRPTMRGHLMEAVPSFTRHGFTPFEQIWHGTDGPDGNKVLVPRKLAYRRPASILEWQQDDLDDLQTIVQYIPHGEYGGRVEIPARDCVYYRIGGEGDNWEGLSLLRAAYKSWLIMDGVERVDAIAQEREATGIPVVYPPQNKANDPVLDEIEENLGKLKAGEEVYIIMPGPKAGAGAEDGQGWLLEILGMSGTSGSTRDPSKTLEHHGKKIAAAVIAEFMELGQHGEGARATADVQQDPFYAGVDALAYSITAPWNEDFIPRVVGVNFDDADGSPTLKLEKIDSTALTELQTYTSGLVTAGALTPDEDLEDWLRERAKMPPADPVERERKKALQEEREQLEVEGLKTPPEEPKPGDKGEEKVVESEEPDPEDRRRKIKKRTKETIKRFDSFELALGTCSECGCEAAVEGVCPACGHEGDVETFGGGFGAEVVDSAPAARERAREREKAKPKPKDGPKDAEFEKLHPRGTGGLFIRKGSSRKQAVTNIQREVGAKGDGDFGLKTEAAVRRFQKKHGLQVDGVVGRQTAMALLGHVEKAKQAKVGKLSDEQVRKLAHQLGNKKD